jgi:hypothetical protein
VIYTLKADIVGRLSFAAVVIDRSGAEYKKRASQPSSARADFWDLPQCLQLLLILTREYDIEDSSSGLIFVKTVTCPQAR